MLDDELTSVPESLRKIVIAAGFYNLIWGLLVIIFPLALFSNLGIPAPEPIFYWQMVGAMTALFGLAYLVSAGDLLRYWPLILIGFLGKTAGTFGFVIAYFNGALPLSFGWIVLFNEVLWIPPFLYVLIKLYRQFIYEERPLEEEYFLEAEFNLVETNHGVNLKDLSEEKPVILVFLRHFGCTFCRETLQEISKHKEVIQNTDKELILIHMSDYERAEKVLAKYNLQDVQHISDINRDIYRYFGLRRGFVTELLGFKEWMRGFVAGVWKKNGIGFIEGDIFQLPGIFVYYKGRIKKKFIHRSAADLPDFEDIACSRIA